MTPTLAVTGGLELVHAVAPFPLAGTKVFPKRDQLYMRKVLDELYQNTISLL